MLKHVAQIVDGVLGTSVESRFLKEAAEWDKMSLEAQKQYLKEHPKSKRKVTARPDEGVKEKIEEKRQDMAKPLDKLQHLAEHNTDREAIVKDLAQSLIDEADEDEEVSGTDLTEDNLRRVLSLPKEGVNTDVDKWITDEIDHFQDDVDSAIGDLK
jgi:ATP-dependent Lon protease